MTYYEVRSNNGIAGRRCYSKKEAIVEAGRMTSAYGVQAKVFRVTVNETEVFSTRGTRCA